MKKIPKDCWWTIPSTICGYVAAILVFPISLAVFCLVLIVALMLTVLTIQTLMED